MENITREKSPPAAAKAQSAAEPVAQVSPRPFSMPPGYAAYYGIARRATTADTDDNGVAPHAPAAVAAAAGSTGAPLPAAVQARFEQSLGADLGGVRVHTGAESAAAAAAVSAQAYTTGSDIHFAAGRYAPDTPAGAHLLAHEVAHTVQQRTGAAALQARLEVSSPADAPEIEADRAADAMVAGQPAQVTPTHDAVMRTGEGNAGGGAAAPAPTEGDQVREAVYQAALKWLKSQDEFMTQAAIDKVREDPRNKNYSTCKDFVTTVMNGARTATGEKQDLAKMVTALNVLLDSEIGLRATVEGDKKSEAMGDPMIKEFQAKIDELKQNPDAPGAKAKMGQLQKAVDSLIAERARRHKKTEKDQAALDRVDQSAQGFKRPTPPLKDDDRPKHGDLIRIVTVETKNYAVGNAAGATLQKGSFLHICVMDHIDNLGKPDEVWHTIDGGGTKATDGLTNGGTPFDPATLRFGRFAVEGWIDVATMVNSNAAATPGQPAQPAQPAAKP